MNRSEAPTETVREAPTAELTAALPRASGAGADARLVLGRYRLLERLGAGAFGVVWRARDEKLERDVAVKAIAADGNEDAHPRAVAARAGREIRAAARLSHPAIVGLYEAADEDGTTYLVSELVRGATLAQLLREGALSDRDVAEVGIALCGGLAHAHAQGVVHRDVKPSNVLVPDADLGEAGAAAAKLTDFGVARVVGAGGDALTRTGDVVGTLAYMAPEQAEGREAGPPADLYALALVLYEALSGVNPVRGGSAVATARKLGATLPPLRRQRRDLPPALCEAVDRALLPRPSDRGTVVQLGRALRSARRELGDEPGTVAAPAVERAATAVTHVAQWRPRRSRERELRDVSRELRALEEGEPWEPAPGPARRRAPAAPLVSGHVLPGLAAGGLVALALATLSANPALTPADPLLAGGIAAAVVGLLPRLGWLACAALLLGWLAGDGGGDARPGLALVLACALAAPPLLLPLRGRAWSVPFAAPLMGVALLAGAFPALAGQARTLWRRAALGALGFWIVALAESVARDPLFYGQVRPSVGAGGSGAWQDSLPDAATVVLGPLLDSGVLACAALWAAGAAVLPWIVRGRTAALDLVAATVWAAALAAGASLIGEALGRGVVPHPDPRGAALGAGAAVLIAVAARAVARPAPRARESDPRGPAVA